MKALLLFLISTVAFTTVLSGKEAPLKVVVSSPGVIFKVSDSPLVQIEIINTTKKLVYIDFKNLQIVPSIWYKQGPNETPLISSSTGPMATDGAVVHSTHLGNHTVGIKPGQVLIRLLKVPELKVSGGARIDLLVNVFLSYTLTTVDKDWKEVQLTASRAITIQP